MICAICIYFASEKVAGFFQFLVPLVMGFWLRAHDGFLFDKFFIFDNLILDHVNFDFCIIIRPTPHIFGVVFIALPVHIFVLFAALFRHLTVILVSLCVLNGRTLALTRQWTRG